MTSACDNLLHPKPKSELQVYAQQTVIANRKLSVRGEIVNCQDLKKNHVESILTSETTKTYVQNFLLFPNPTPYDLYFDTKRSFSAFLDRKSVV